MGLFFVISIWMFFWLCVVVSNYYSLSFNLLLFYPYSCMFMLGLRSGVKFIGLELDYLYKSYYRNLSIARSDYVDYYELYLTV
jgi:hypothetical protein